MSKGIENIDEVFKQAFDGFEADVDPSVWNNIQSSIASGSVASSSANSVGLGKSVILKIAAGIIAVGAIATTTYYVTISSEQKEELIISQEVNPDFVSEEQSELNSVAEYSKEKETSDEIENRNEEDHSIASDEFNSGVESNNVELDLNSEANQDDNSIPNQISEKAVEKITDETSTEEDVVQSKVENKSKQINTEEIKALRGSLRASVISGKAPLDVSFDVEGENIASYSWDFGDDSENGDGASSFHTFNKPGSYKVKVIVLDENANSKTLVQIIEVKNNMESSLGFIPNSFTPNGDENNDVFILTTARNIKSFKGTVVSESTRKVVFMWNDIKEGWDGSNMSGRKLPSGNYYITLKAVGLDGEVLTRNLKVSLFKE